MKNILHFSQEPHQGGEKIGRIRAGLMRGIFLAKWHFQGKPVGFRPCRGQGFKVPRFTVDGLVESVTPVNPELESLREKMKGFQLKLFLKPYSYRFTRFHIDKFKGIIC